MAGAAKLNRLDRRDQCGTGIRLANNLRCNHFRRGTCCYTGCSRSDLCGCRFCHRGDFRDFGCLGHLACAAVTATLGRWWNHRFWDRRRGEPDQIVIAHDPFDQRCLTGLGRHRDLRMFGHRDPLQATMLTWMNSATSSSTKIPPRAPLAM